MLGAEHLHDLSLPAFSPLARVRPFFRTAISRDLAQVLLLRHTCACSPFCAEVCGVYVWSHPTPRHFSGLQMAFLQQKITRQFDIPCYYPGNGTTVCGRFYIPIGRSYQSYRILPEVGRTGQT